MKKGENMNFVSERIEGEDDIEYFNLVELIFHYNCRGCTRCDYQNCDFYKEFEENSIPELVDTQVGKCKYYYEELK